MTKYVAPDHAPCDGLDASGHETRHLASGAESVTRALASRTGVDCGDCNRSPPLLLPLWLPSLPLVYCRAPTKSAARFSVVQHIMSGRAVHAKAILGQELYGRLSHTKVLLVGAGGIGCELRA